MNSDNFVEEFGRLEMKQFDKKYVPDLNLMNLISDFTVLKASLCHDHHAMENLLRSPESDIDDILSRPSLLKYAIRIQVPTYAIACAHIVTVFPHSMYVERLVSSHNLVKSNISSSMERSTINNYLFVKECTGPVTKFDPHPAIVRRLSVRQHRPKTNEDGKIQNYKKRMMSVGNFFLSPFRGFHRGNCLAVVVPHTSNAETMRQYV